MTVPAAGEPEPLQAAAALADSPSLAGGVISFPLALPSPGLTLLPQQGCLRI